MSTSNTQLPSDEIESCLAGQRLYGDDFSQSQIEAWYEGEKEGYAGLGAGDRENYRYAYRALNMRHGFRYLPDVRFTHALGLGSAYGDEFVPLKSRVGRLTIVDPSERFENAEVHGIPAEYVKPRPDGRLPFADSSFDLVTCLGVLHHIPNVSFVLGELQRVCKLGGIALVREPIVSMGDWRKPRRGLTRNERGIPLQLFRLAIEKAGFETVHEGLCVFPPLVKMAGKLGIAPFNNDFITWLDDVMAHAFEFNTRYHATHWLHRFRPASAYFVLTK